MDNIGVTVASLFLPASTPTERREFVRGYDQARETAKDPLLIDLCRLSGTRIPTADIKRATHFFRDGVFSARLM
jgi:hypothetical protein